MFYPDAIHEVTTAIEVGEEVPVAEDEYDLDAIVGQAYESVPGGKFVKTTTIEEFWDIVVCNRKES